MNVQSITRQWLSCAFVSLSFTIAYANVDHYRHTGDHVPRVPHVGTKNADKSKIASTPLKLPAYQPIRQNEDWSILATATTEQQQADPWNKLKYMNFDKHGWASFGGHLRWRDEVWDNFYFDRQNDENFHLFRATAHGDFHLNDNLRAFIEGKSTWVTTRDLPGQKRTLDIDTYAIQQAFVDMRFPINATTSVVLRPGRQMLAFGKDRLVSILPWGNTLHTWSGVSAQVKNPIANATLFATRFVPVNRYHTNIPDKHDKFNGAYVTSAVTPLNMGLELYYFYHSKGGAVYDRQTGAERRQTTGSRLFGQFGKSHAYYEMEGAYQFGSFENKQIRAYMLTTMTGYKFEEATLTPDVHVNYDYASGGDPEGNRMKTFSHLFPLGHAYLGFIDVVARQNIHDISGGIAIQPTDIITLSVDYHMFWRANKHDALYDAGANLVRAGNAGTASKIGNEIDFLVNCKWNRHVSGLLGYNELSPGKFIEQSGDNAHTRFGYLQLQYTV